jgi:hypothetical protein
LLEEAQVADQVQLMLGVGVLVDLELVTPVLVQHLTV